MARTRAVIPLGAIMLLLLPSEASADPITLFGTGLGSIHVDTASVFVALGTLVVLVEWSSTTRQRWAAWAAVPLLATPFTIAQRATLLQLAATILVIGWAMAQPEWRDRMHVARLQLIKGVLVVVAAVSVVLVFHLRDHGAEVPFAGYYEDTFTSTSQQESVDSRLDSFAVGIDEWSESWPFGYGLGHSFRITRTFGSTVQELAWFDNVPLDLLVRVGLVGFVLTIAALVATLRDGLRVWRRHARRHRRCVRPRRRRGAHRPQPQGGGGIGAREGQGDGAHGPVRRGHRGRGTQHGTRADRPAPPRPRPPPDHPTACAAERGCSSVTDPVSKETPHGPERLRTSAAALLAGRR